MSLGDQSSDRDRIRVGLIVLALGLGLVCVSAAMALLRGPTPPDVIAQQQAAAANADAVARARAALLGLMYGTLLLIVLATFAYALRRHGHRLTGRFGRKPAPPTPTDDVWAMHRLPEHDEPDIDDLSAAESGES